jgi:hypothetical protein
MMNATRIFDQSRRLAGSRQRPSIFKRSANSGSTATTAPPWTTILKRSLVKKLSRPNPSKFSAISKWPVDETGMNSVTPSMNPRMIAVSQGGKMSNESGIWCGCRRSNPDAVSRPNLPSA